jgi:protein-S-isoprenylcysteine O-methyltransferase Ste14
MAPESDQGLAASPSMSEEWSNKAVDTVDLVVDVVHDKVVRPALVAGRAVVFGMLIAFVALVLLVLLAVGFVRLLDVYAFGGRVWASDALLGALFAGGGLFLWTKRTKRHESDS